MLRAKLNVAAIVLFAIAAAVATLVGRSVLYANARQDVVRSATLLMESASSIRTYTFDQVRPRLAPLQADEFLPQSVPAYAAQQTLQVLRKRLPGYSYKEATLNATNPADEAVGWEVGMVQQLRREPARREIVADRYDEDGQRHVVVARAIRIEQRECLACHSEPAAAPPSMIKVYGPARGFGWTLDQVVGAQIVSVPTELAESGARAALRSMLWLLLGIFAVLFVVLNVVLDRVVVAPLKRLSKLANEASLGRVADLGAFIDRRDEIGRLANAFERMMSGLRRAIGIIDRDPPPRTLRGTRGR
ncbi:MAG TPA: DUF3365 domain-containing protein [Burkholderiaceae bacterium]|nr:DUF3365 domain-containing protein [Burkholderiaceae bacterium]